MLNPLSMTTDAHSKIACSIPEVVPPQQLEHNPVGGLVGLPFRLILLDLVVDGSGRQAAMGQPGAELGAVVAAQHSIASLEVGGYEV